MSTATHADTGILRVPVQIQKLPVPAIDEAEMELSDDELEAVVGGLARAVHPAPLFPVAA